MTAAAVLKGRTLATNWRDLQRERPDLVPHGINLKWLANENSPIDWHIGGHMGGREGAILTGPIKGMVHVPFQGIWHEPAYGPPRYERKVDKRREISTRVLLISDNEFGWFNTEERWWNGMDGDLPGHWSIFTQKYGELYCPMLLLEASETAFEFDPTDDESPVMMEWDILLAADGEPRWRQPDVRPFPWVNDMSRTTQVRRDDEKLSPMITVGVGQFRVANRGTQKNWPIFTVSAPGRCWLPNGTTGQMIRVPKLNKGEHVTIDTNPEHRIVISDTDPKTNQFKQFLNNSELLKFLFGSVTESGQTVLERFHGQGFDAPIEPGTVATLPVYHSQPGARISVRLPQLFERAVS